MQGPQGCRTVTSSSGCGSSVTTCETKPFRLTRTLRRQLSQCLDPPNTSCNDWRMLAQKLDIDRSLNSLGQYFILKIHSSNSVVTLIVLLCVVQTCVLTRNCQHNHRVYTTLVLITILRPFSCHISLPVTHGWQEWRFLWTHTNIWTQKYNKHIHFRISLV